MCSDDAKPVRQALRSAVPEIAIGLIEIKAIRRISGVRTKCAVHSLDPNVDCVAACVGENENRIKNVVDALSGERIDILRWSEDPEVFICNCVQPAVVMQVVVDVVQRRAKVLVPEDQESLARGRRGENLKLTSALCGYEVEIEAHRGTGR